MRCFLPVGAAGGALPMLAWPLEASAHGFAVRYGLPIPLGFFLAGAGATVVLSFLLMALIARNRTASATHSTAHRLLPKAAQFLSNRWVAGLLQGISIALFLLVLAAALFGNINPFKNIATTFVWIIWWVGMMFINIFVGDIWALVNPWNAIFAAAEKALRRWRPDARLSFERPYPERLGVWPAVVLFLCFAWIEIISGEGEDVRKLGSFIVAYTLITWTGMIVFGRRAWLVHREAFTVVFSTFARFAPFAYSIPARGNAKRCSHGGETVENTTIGCAACFETAPAAERGIVVRFPGIGLLAQRAIARSTAALVFVLLATVTFDGFIATPAWTALYQGFTALGERALAIGFVFNFYVLATMLFLLLPALLAGAFLACCRITAAAARSPMTTGEIARYFVLTLLPIAIAYHFTHYFTYLLLAGQYIIPAVSDPFGFAWDVFGTASYKPDIALVGAKFYWYTGVIAIVTGHIIAVYLAHRTAQRLFGERRKVLASQFPLLALMVAYTMLSLWIIAQPTVQA